MTKSLTLVRNIDNIMFRSSVVYNATRKLFYIYDASKEAYVVIDASGNNYYPTIEIRNKRDAEHYIKIEFERGDRIYSGDSTAEDNWIVFKPINVVLVDDSKTLNAHKTVARKPSVHKNVRKPATRKVKRA